MLKSRQLTFPPKIPITSNSKDFIRKCLKYHETDRMSWKELYIHPVFNGFFDKVEIKENNKSQINPKKP